MSRGVIVASGSDRIVHLMPIAKAQTLPPAPVLPEVRGRPKHASLLTKRLRQTARLQC